MRDRFTLLLSHLECMPSKSLLILRAFYFSSSIFQQEGVCLSLFLELINHIRTPYAVFEALTYLSSSPRSPPKNAGTFPGHTQRLESSVIVFLNAGAAN